MNGARGWVRALEQLRFLVADVARITNGRWWRYGTAPFSVGFMAVLVYRLDRGAYLALGRGWPVLRAILGPIRALLRPWSGRCEIHYGAEIGPGLLILHPSLGIVVAASAVIGARLTLTGGNCIGIRGSGPGEFVLGSGLVLGANATVIGPVVIGDDVRIGAGAVVIDDIPSGVLAAGVPARVVS